MSNYHCSKCQLITFSQSKARVCECGGPLARIDKFGVPLVRPIVHCGCGGIMERVPHLRCPVCNYEPYKSPTNSQRDTYRSRVYAWERKFKKWPGTRLELNACKKLVDDIWADLRPGEDPPVVLASRGYRWARGSRAKIKLPKWAKTTFVVIHETTHSLLKSIKPNHGKEFCIKYLELLKKYAGLEAEMPTFFTLAPAGTPKEITKKEKSMDTKRHCPICEKTLQPTAIADELACKNGHYWKHAQGGINESFVRSWPGTAIVSAADA